MLRSSVLAERAPRFGEIGIAVDDYLLTRVEVVGQARANSRALARYLALINVSLLIVSGSMTLVVQRWLTRRSGTPV